VPYFVTALPLSPLVTTRPLSPAHTIWVTVREQPVLLQNTDSSQQLTLSGEEIMALWVAWCWRPVQASGSAQEASAPPVLSLGSPPGPWTQ